MAPTLFRHRRRQQVSQAEVDEGAAVEVAGAADEVEGAADAVNGAAVESTDVAAPRKGTPVALPLHHAGNLPGSTLMSLAATGWAQAQDKVEVLGVPEGDLVGCFHHVEKHRLRQGL